MCPFHVELRREKRQLSIKLPAAKVGSTAWRCYRKDCVHSDGGSIIDFEIAITKQLHGKTSNPSTAWKHIIGIMRGVKRKEDAAKQAVTAGIVEMNHDI